jgi:hypothetical protein
MTAKATWALFCAYVNEYGVRRIVAHPVMLTDTGILNPQFGPYERGAELADFEVSAYLSDDLPRAWGWSFHFAPRHVDLKRAEVCVRVLRRVDRGVQRIDRMLGLASEFDGFLARVALVLGIDRYVVAGDSGIAFLNGSGFTLHDEAGIRDWIACQERAHGARDAHV